jgi:hypothetical protein
MNNDRLQAWVTQFVLWNEAFERAGSCQKGYPGIYMPHKYHCNTHRTGSTWCPQVFSQPRTFSRSAPQPVLLHASTPLVDPSRLYPLKEGLVYRRHSCVRYRAANGFPWKYSGTPAYDKCIAVPRICVRGTREFNSNKEVILVLLT